MTSINANIAGNQAQQDEEIEALQAIYGDELSIISSTPTDRLLQFKLPSALTPRLELRLALHRTYPSDHIPVVTMVGVHITDALSDWATEKLEDLFCPGDPVIYDWVEWIKEQPLLLPPEAPPLQLPEMPSSSARQGEEPADGRHTDEGGPSTRSRESDEEFDVCRRRTMQDLHSFSLEHPDQTHVVHGNPLTEKKSTFQAHLAPVTSTEGVRKAMDSLMLNPKVQRATHNIMAYRIRCSNGSIMQDCDDDGESAAGGRLLHLLQILDAVDVVVVVSRWYGGVLLGPARFTHINNAARQLLDECGYVKKDSSSKKQKGSSK